MSPSTLPGRRLKRRLRLLISMLKGGAGKSTTTWFLCLAFARWGLKVVAVDADLGSRTLSTWYDLAKKLEARGAPAVPFTVLVWKGEDEDGPLSDFMEAAEADYEPDVIAGDTGGERREVFMSACLWANRLLSPCGTSEPEIFQLHQTKNCCSQVARYSPIAMSVLLNKVSAPRAGMAKDARAMITATEKIAANRFKPYGIDVMLTEISNRSHMYSLTFGTVSDDLGEFGELAHELADEMDEE